MAASQNRNKSPDAEALEEDELQYGHGPLSKEELEDKYPNRPVNHSKTLPFHDLYTYLFNPLNENKKRPAGPAIARAKQGPHGPSRPSAYQERENIVDRFISRWRNEVGSDFYPAIRLIIPDKDRDRPMYGLKEAAIGKILVKVLKLTPKSEDGYNLLHWKLPGQTTASRMAGDFAGRCYEVLKKREMRSKPGDLTIAEVNSMLDKLAAAQGQKGQEEIFEYFYNNMNAEELMWLIRIILRQMKIGASEKTLLTHWHPDGEALFNVSSSLRRVCWELTDPEERLEEEDSRISLMSCFQPQLAQFQMNSFQTMLAKMGINEEHPQFWIEEKMDGERMQMHMMEDDSVPGGKRFNFWSRKAKDYTYLYGNSFEDENSALTGHLKEAFHPDVRNIILDGEMITWDPEADIMVPFGTLKTAALSEQRNPYQGTGPRPLFRVFDMLFLNGTAITKFELKDRRKALEKSVNNVHRRLEIHEYQETTKLGDIDPRLREIVAQGSEGLVLKNPRSAYRLSERNNDWMKVKPEYMEEFGESLDCVIIGGYYGSGHRGGRLSSFLCGLRTDLNRIQQGDDPEKCYSFFKVGGGFRAEDYAEIKHRTDGLWTDWDRSNPPRKYICLGAGEKQFERPDVWIRPSKSVVVSAKAASVGPSESFAIGLTLRFPRFKKLRTDKSWDQALDISEFLQLKDRAFAESKERQFKVDDSRRKRTKKLKKEKHVQGNDITSTPYAGPQTAIFEGLNFFVATDMISPIKKSKGELEQLIKANGGAIYQGPIAKEHMIVIGDKKVVKVASLIRHGVTNIVRGKWILDCLKQAEIDIGKERYLVPFEPGHMFHTMPDAVEMIDGNVDGYGDSYARHVDAAQLKDIIKEMNFVKMEGFDGEEFLGEVEENGHSEFKEGAKGWLLKGCIIYIPFPPKDQENNIQEKILINQILFAGGKVVDQLEDEGVTHVIVVDDKGNKEAKEAKREEIKAIRRSIADLMTDDGMRIPRIVGSEWVAESLREGTLLDEERYSFLA